MFRMRRYRVFLLIAALSAATLYYLVNVRHATLSDVERFRHFSFGQKSHEDQLAQENSQHLPSEHEPDSPPELTHPPPPDPEDAVRLSPTSTSKRVGHATLDDFAGHTHTSTAANEAETVTGEELLLQIPDKEESLKGVSGSQWKADYPPGQAPQAHWRPQKEHNPVPEDKLIKLPEGKPKVLNRIQHEFPSESDAQKADRLRKLVTVRESFKHAWQGYVKYAMPHDELLSVSKSYGDSFMGWGATLVDSLDTLWILDLKEEFEVAVNETEKIDFTTSHRKQIPLFETVIRILGGLIAAHDLSQEQYPVLLEKAVELADIIMGAFDTPNRMPDLFYKWAPSYASQQHRAGTGTGLAQLGSLSLEFTRLAQITKEHRYYDAIARVQNALEEWQMKTEMPGLWPLTFDASGCKKVDQVKVQSDSADNNEKPILIDSDQITEEELTVDVTPAKKLPNDTQDSRSHSKRQADDNSAPAKPDSAEMNADSRNDTARASSTQVAPPPVESDDLYCRAQGLSYEPYAKKHKFGIAAQADSTYEYMPKMHRLLGGLSSQYESMYQNAAKMIREKILYRPMIEDERRKILFPAAYEYDRSNKIHSRRIMTSWEATHLGCFAGGMFGLAAKTFDIPSDMEIAKQLTDGCVWAYQSTPTKIMPEKFALTPCENPNTCPWSEAAWHKALDPKMKERLDAVDDWNNEQKKLYKQTGMNVAKDAKQMDHPVVPKPQPTVFAGGIKKDPVGNKADGLIKRDPPVREDPTNALSDLYETDDLSSEHSGFIPKVAMSHARYAKARIQEERLSPGYTKVHDRSYILRPEAIESVFIMWRMTGEDYWRQEGWNMFQAIQEATHTEAGNAELEDVTSILGEKKDKMESFWLAETLKYFYLLFSDPSVISLDDYVLNTEAHPFKVPKP